MSTRDSGLHRPKGTSRKEITTGTILTLLVCGLMLAVIIFYPLPKPDLSSQPCSLHETSSVVGLNGASEGYLLNEMVNPDGSIRSYVVSFGGWLAPDMFRAILELPPGTHVTVARDPNNSERCVMHIPYSLEQLKTMARG